MNSFDVKDTRSVIDNVTAQLARAEHFDGYSYISTPLLFPNGGTVIVRVQRSAIGDFHVSDHGIGYDEAEMIDGKYYYSRIAPSVADAAGIGFDQHSFFTMQVNESQLAGAIVTVANCVSEAVTQVFYKVEEYKAQNASDRMHAKLTSVFKTAQITRAFQIRGASNHEWTFDTMVKRDANIILFEHVSRSHNSVYAAVTKFHDVARAENAPVRAAVIGKKGNYGDYLSLMSQASSVIEQDAPNSVFEKLAA